MLTQAFTVDCIMISKTLFLIQTLLVMHAFQIMTTVGYADLSKFWLAALVLMQAYHHHVCSFHTQSVHASIPDRDSCGTH